MKLAPGKRERVSRRRDRDLLGLARAFAEDDEAGAVEASVAPEHERRRGLDDRRRAAQAPRRLPRPQLGARHDVLGPDLRGPRPPPEREHGRLARHDVLEERHGLAAFGADARQDGAEAVVVPQLLARPRVEHPELGVAVSGRAHEHRAAVRRRADVAEPTVLARRRIPERRAARAVHEGESLAFEDRADPERAHDPRLREARHDSRRRVASPRPERLARRQLDCLDLRRNVAEHVARAAVGEDPDRRVGAPLEGTRPELRARRGVERHELVPLRVGEHDRVAEVDLVDVVGSDLRAERVARRERRLPPRSAQDGVVGLDPVGAGDDERAARVARPAPLGQERLRRVHGGDRHAGVLAASLEHATAAHEEPVSGRGREIPRLHELGAVGRQLGRRAEDSPQGGLEVGGRVLSRHGVGIAPRVARQHFGRERARRALGRSVGAADERVFGELGEPRGDAPTRAGRCSRSSSRASRASASGASLLRGASVARRSRAPAASDSRPPLRKNR